MQHTKNCADCRHESPVVEAADAMVKDANGNVPADGDQTSVLRGGALSMSSMLHRIARQ